MSEFLSKIGDDAASDVPFALSQPRMLRLSVTDRCNFRCLYCVPPRGLHRTSNKGPLSFEPLAENVRWLAQHAPIERVKLTGGEPLVRPGIEELIARLAGIEGIREISMTTNGSLLANRAEGLKAAGLARVNISLDSVDPARFSEFSRGARLECTIAGIHAAVSAGLLPLKLNAVLQRSTWMYDVPPLLDLAAEHGVEIRFIELMRSGTERAWYESEIVGAGEVKSWLAAQTEVVAVGSQAAVPAENTIVNWKGMALKVGWIAPRSNPFCSSCERLRMDSRGRLRRCLMDPVTLDVCKLRAMPESAAIEAFATYLAQKRPPTAMDCDSSMIQIGG